MQTERLLSRLDNYAATGDYAGCFRFYARVYGCAQRAGSLKAKARLHMIAGAVYSRATAILHRLSGQIAMALELERQSETRLGL
jgi:hypothetical protein